MTRKVEESDDDMNNDEDGSKADVVTKKQKGETTPIISHSPPLTEADIRNIMKNPDISKNRRRKLRAKLKKIMEGYLIINI